MIDYSYEIVEVNKPAKCMLVRYSAEGHSERLVGTRMPFTGESLESVVQEYAPIGLWIQEKTEIADVQVGLSGTILSSPTVTEDPANNQLLITEEEQILANEEYQKELIRGIVTEVLNEQSV